MTKPILNLGSKPSESDKGHQEEKPKEQHHEQQPPVQTPPSTGTRYTPPPSTGTGTGSPPQQAASPPVQQTAGEGRTLAESPPGTGDTREGAALARIAKDNVGRATFYGGNINGGNCGMTGYTLPPNYCGVAMSSVTWAASMSCGSCIQATWKGKVIRCMVLDQCPECEQGHLDLFQDAFTQLADQSLGIIPDLHWRVIDCALNTGMKYVWKDGVTEYYFAIQVRDANFPVVKFEVSKDSGATFIPCKKQSSSGYWTADGRMGWGPFLFRVTAQSGEVLTHGPFMMDGHPKQAAGNFQ